ncbi:unnamed protein product [Hymenolepis diminuta]|uniref:Uncharacterized protein n=1 Tax=Hymenolepis diminuta TaxID=6216 RepID=A0A564Y4E3_HYMDI|nr:unnamed protein product [Hymenolepis diminuta]
MNNNLIEGVLSHDDYKILNKKMERRTDFDMKATEAAEVVDVVGDDCEEVGCDESDVDAEFGGFGAE